MNVRGNALRMVVGMLAAALLGACGQRGALYLPEESRNVVVTPAPPAASSVPMGSPVPAAAPTPATQTTEEEERRKDAAAPAK